MSEDIEPWGGEPGPSSFLAAQQAGADGVRRVVVGRLTPSQTCSRGSVSSRERFLAEALHVCRIKHG